MGIATSFGNQETVLHGFLSFSASMAISDNCRCIFGPHGTKQCRSLFSNLMTNKQAICNTYPETRVQEKEIVTETGEISTVLLTQVVICHLSRQPGH